MPAKFDLTWDSTNTRWRVMYRGKRFVVSCRQLGTPESKEASYQAANAWWQAKRAEIDGQTLADPHYVAVKAIGQRIDWSKKFDPANENIASDVTFLGSEQWEARLEATAEDKPVKGKTTTEHLAEYLTVEGLRASSGQLSKAEYGITKLCLDYFVAWLGVDVTRLDAQKWEDYWAHLVGLDISIEYKKKRFRHARNFVLWLDSKGVLLAPRNMSNRKYKFGSSIKAIETMTLRDVQELVDGAPGQLKLHLMLMINCGYTQQDIADLRRDEIDFKAGRITRKRSKTSDVSTVPTVSYKLWKPTLALLKQYVQPSGDLALLTISGQPWVRPTLQDGKFQRIDSIKSNFVHLQKKTGINKAIKLLRKTSASLLNSHETHCQQVALFLGHSPRTMAERHYAAVGGDRFDKAIDWLGKQYGF